MRVGGAPAVSRESAMIQAEPMQNHFEISQKPRASVDQAAKAGIQRLHHSIQFGSLSQTDLIRLIHSRFYACLSSRSRHERDRSGLFSVRQLGLGMAVDALLGLFQHGLGGLDNRANRVADLELHLLRASPSDDAFD